jgi:polygalacturonase
VVVAPFRRVESNTSNWLLCVLAAPLVACGASTSVPAVLDGATGVSGGGPQGSADASGDESATSSDGAASAGDGAFDGGSGTIPPEAGVRDGSFDGGKWSACTADPNLPPEPQIPPACATLLASRAVDASGLPSEADADTARIQAALDACATGRAVRLAPNGASDAFLTGPLTIPSGVSLWIDTGATLYGTRDLGVYAGASALIKVSGAGSAIAGGGVIDGQGGEPIVGKTTSFWDANGSGGSSPALIQVSSATQFTLYGITLHNAPKFHVKLGAAGFVVWGVTIKTPSKTRNSAGVALTPSSAHNTDGIDPGEAASNGYIVCTDISDGDDQIAIKGSVGVANLTIAHDHFLAGHGMSIGSEFQGGVSHVNVYDLSIDGTGSGLSGGSSNGIRIKSDSSRGGLVSDVTYSDVCTRQIANPILLTPYYSTMTGSNIPDYAGITIRSFHALGGGKVTVDGYDAAHPTEITLDNVIVDGVAASDVTAQYANVTLGPGSVNFTPSGTGVTVDRMISGSSQPNSCSGKWVTF